MYYYLIACVDSDEIVSSVVPSSCIRKDTCIHESRTKSLWAVNYQNSIDGVTDEGKVTDNECQQVGGHFLSWLKNCLLHTVTINGDVA